MTNMLLLWQIFILFTRVAMFSWGGGPASLALMQRETTSATWTPPGQTDRVPWITPDEFADAVAIGNAIPGPIAPQVSAYVGYQLAGLPGSDAIPDRILFWDQEQSSGKSHAPGSQTCGSGFAAVDSL
jgi:chromate transport protein ChrA